MDTKTKLRELAVQLYDVGAIKYGDFVTKVGLKTPIYIDLRVIISYPKLMVQISKMLWSLMDADQSSEYSHICGVPYTALPIATVISAETNVPMIIRRKEAKSYGTKKLIEGAFVPGDTAVIVEDIITSGSSVLETAQDLIREGLKVAAALVIVDREQGGKKNLESAGIKVKSLFKITELMETLMEAERLTPGSVRIVTDYISRKVELPMKTDEILTDPRLSQDFASRAKSAKNPVASKLLKLMASKKTTICLAADFAKTESILEIAELAGPHIAVLKIHVDIIEDFSRDSLAKLKTLSTNHNFLVMEDRKFADIGHVVSRQLSQGIYRIAEWADLITIHAVPGKGILDGIRTGWDNVINERGLFIVAEMSSAGALTAGNYTNAAIAMAKDDASVAGFVCQKNIFSDPGLVQLTPGVNLVKSGDALGQQYNTPEDVVKSGADLIVVGRGITEAEDKLQAILEYKKVLFEAYEKRVSK